MAEQQNSTDEEDLQKQLNSRNNGLPEVFNQPISNELNNGSKRPLSDELKDSDRTKKTRLTENGSLDQIQIITSHPDNNNTKANTEVVVSDQDCEVIDAETDLSVEYVNDNIVNEINDTSKESFSQLLKLIGEKELLYEKFHSFFTAKCIEIITERLHKSKKVRSENQLMWFKKVQLLQKNYSLLLKKVRDLTYLFKEHKDKLKLNKLARPMLLTRTDGLQVGEDENRGGSILLPNPEIQLKHIIIRNIDDDTAIVEEIYFKPSSTKTADEMIPKMQSPPTNIARQSPIISSKAISGANIINTEESISSYKVICLPEGLENLRAQLKGNSPKHITYADDHPTSSSNCTVRTPTSDSHQRTTVLNRDKSFTTSQLPIPIFAIPTHTTIDRSLMEFQKIQQPHPARVPEIPYQKHTSLERLPPAPRVTHYRKLNRPGSQELALSWTMDPNETMAEVAFYEIIAYRENCSVPPDLWKKVGVVRALALPMECILSQLICGETYHCAVRAVDVNNHVGPFSKPKSLLWD